jgi:hypothetical protein
MGTWIKKKTLQVLFKELTTKTAFECHFKKTDWLKLQTKQQTGIGGFSIQRSEQQVCPQKKSDQMFNSYRIYTIICYERQYAKCSD